MVQATSLSNDIRNEVLQRIPASGIFLRSYFVDHKLPNTMKNNVALSFSTHRRHYPFGLDPNLLHVIYTKCHKHLQLWIQSV